MINNLKNNKLLVFTIITVSFFFLFDIGNIDSIRQGTEGFYLQISKEMFKNGNFLTPLYYGTNHWSKPPLHFWSAMILFFVSGGPSLLLARISTAIIAIFGLLFIARWNKRNLEIKQINTILFLASSLAFIKYSRIYMMEIPLAILSVSASLKFYDFLKNGKTRDLIISSIILGLATLVKGPVALVMCLGSIGIYYIYSTFVLKEKILKQILIWAIFSVIIGSIWFIACYLKHGSEFFEYFFLRENIGKFSGKSFPVSSVIQGLLIYGLPWSIFIPVTIYFLKKRFMENRDTLIKGPFPFLIIHFLFFLILWFVPSQRSHHYAIPSIPFFLIISCAALSGLLKNPESILKNLTFKVPAICLTVFLGIFVLALILLFVIFQDKIPLWFLILMIFMALGWIYTLFKPVPSHFYKLNLLSFLFLGTIWIFLIPIFFLPVLPNDAKVIIGNQKTFVVFRKPVYIEEALGRTIFPISSDQIHKKINTPESVTIIREEIFKIMGLNKNGRTILKTWKIWRRNISTNDIIHAISNRNPALLQENMFLVN